MMRTIRLMMIFALTAVAMLAAPENSYAEKSCIDQFYRCYNDASAFDGVSQDLAEAECSVEYVGCVAAKLKFW